MTAYAALLRAVNVGGTGKLPMTELRAICARLGFADAATYLASGNAVFHSDATAAEVRERLESALTAYMGKPQTVLIRDAGELAACRDANPFQDTPGNRAFVLFLDTTAAADTLDDLRHRTNEVLIPGDRHLYVNYPDGAGASRLVIPAAADGTMRNMNTVTKLAEMTAGLT